METEPAQLVAAYKAAAAEVVAVQERLRVAHDAKVEALRHLTVRLPARDVAALLGVTRQRVYKLLGPKNPVL